MALDHEGEGVVRHHRDVLRLRVAGGCADAVDICVCPVSHPVLDEVIARLHDTANLVVAQSTMRRDPLFVKAQRRGLLNRAAWPRPLVLPEELPSPRNHVTEPMLTLIVAAETQGDGCSTTASAARVVMATKRRCMWWYAGTIKR
jgi:hypothetical protein